MSELLWRLVRRVYGLPNVEEGLDEGGVIVAAGYGIAKEDVRHLLPDATKAVLEEVRRLYGEDRPMICWASSGYFERPFEFEDLMKRGFLRQLGISTQDLEDRLVMAGGITNSVTEAWAIRRKLNSIGCHPSKIIVVCNWAHARSMRYIYREVFFDVHVVIRSVGAAWQPTHCAWWQRSPWRWLVACVLRHAALRVFGLAFAARVQHPLARETRPS